MTLRSWSSTIVMALVAVPAFPHTEQVRSVDWSYSVRPGDTLEALSRRYLRNARDWVRVQALNQVPNPRRLRPGSLLRLPLAWMKTESTVARVGPVTGDVTVGRAGGKAPERVRQGMSLVVGDTVRTNAQGNVTLEFSDGTQMLLLGDSVLQLDTLLRYGLAPVFDNRSRLEQGRSENVAPRTRDPATQFEVRTRAGVTSVRGTQWRVAVPPEGDAARTETVHGEVALANAGSMVGVREGFGTISRAGEPPAEPVPLLRAPALDDAATTLAVTPLRLAFGTVPGAAAYRVQVSATPAFQSTLVDAVIDTPPAPLGDLGNGSFWVRVRAIDANGLEGLDAEHAMTVAAVPAAPMLLEPEPGTVIAAGQPRFRWQAADRRFRHRLQVASDPGFDHLVIDRDAADDAAIALPEDLPAGLFHWRMRAVDAVRGEGAFSAAGSFRIAPRPVELVLPEVTPDALVLGWGPTGEAGEVRVQIAPDSAFGTTDIDRRADRSPLRLARPAPGRHFVRAARIGVDGYEGAFGAPVAIDLQPPPVAPVPLAPDDAVLAGNDTIRFSWQNSPAASRYRFQLAADAAFSSPLIDLRELPDAAFDTRVPASPGVYFWRVAAGNPIDGDGAFSAARAVRRATPMPTIRDPSLDPARLTLHWSAGTEGQGYQVELTRDRGFADRIVDRRITGTTATVPRPAPGRYFVRVRPVEPDGAVLVTNDMQIVDIPGAPRPPALLAPEPGAVSENATPTFVWEPGPPTLRYRFELAGDPGFAPPVTVTDGIAADRHTVPVALDPAAYWWRVQSIDDRDGGSGPGIARGFRVAPPTPTLRPLTMRGKRLEVRWAATGSSLWFDLEVARDREFRLAASNVRLRDRGADVPAPHPGRYFARVRAIGADGVAGAFSDVRMLTVPPHGPRESH